MDSPLCLIVMICLKLQSFQALCHYLPLPLPTVMSQAFLCTLPLPTVMSQAFLCALPLPTVVCQAFLCTHPLTCMLTLPLLIAFLPLHLTNIVCSMTTQVYQFWLTSVFKTTPDPRIPRRLSIRRQYVTVQLFLLPFPPQQWLARVRICLPVDEFQPGLTQ